MLETKGEFGPFGGDGESKVGVGGEDNANAESWVGSWGVETITSGCNSAAGVWESFWCPGTYNLCLDICVNRDISSKCDIARILPNLAKILQSA